MTRSDTFARDVKLVFRYSCPETDRTAVAEADYKKDIFDDGPGDGFYRPEEFVKVPECPLCGQSHVVSL